MNTHHQTFLLEYYRTGDKKQAYRKAYPKTKDSNLTNSVNRLMAKTDIAEAINEQRQKTQEDVAAEIAARYRAELIGFYEAQVYLTKIIRGQHTVTKQIKLKDRLETIEVSPSISEVLRALNTFFRLNNHYPKQQQATIKRNSTTEFPLRHTGSSMVNAGEAEVVLPPEPERTIHPHPFGNIYPSGYPGPYYDPGDPNTKEKLQNLKLNQEPVPSPVTPSPVIASDSEAISRQQEHQGRHFERSAASEKSPEPMQPAQPESTSDIATPQEISSPECLRDRNDEQHSTTNNNKPESSPPVLRLGGPQDRGGSAQHGQTTTNNNKPQQNKPISRVQQQIQWKAKLDQLRKEGWEHINELFSDIYNTYLANQHSGTWKMLQQFEKARDSRHLPLEEREKIIQQTGWEYHPEHPQVMRKKKRVNV